MLVKRNLTILGVVAVLGLIAASNPLYAADQPRTVRDLMWVWGNPEMAKQGPHTTATFAKAGCAERARLLDVPNIVVAGHGVPTGNEQADAIAREVAVAPRQVWEIGPDGGLDGDGNRPFVYTKRLAQVRRLVDRYPQFEGVLIDDMSTLAIDKGFKPEHIRDIRQALDGKYAAVKVWGVLYTMNFNRPEIDKYIEELDGIQLWTWHAKDLVNLEENVAHCERKYPGKPIVLGLYLYNYGIDTGRPMPRKLLEQQCETALRLAHAGRVQGIVFLTINDDPEAVQWTADWIKRVGDQKLGEPATVSDEPVTRLEIGDGRGWQFTTSAGATNLNYKPESAHGMPWKEAADGVIRPPNMRSLHSRAFFTERSFGDLTAEFEVNCDYRETGSGGAGFIFRAADVNHFYMLYIPWGGQQLRAKHFWASIVKVDGDGYLRTLKSAYVPGVPSETDRWYKVRLEAKGPNMEVWVDGRRALSVVDDSYKSGAAGLAGYGWYCFRNVKITGENKPLAAWDRRDPAPINNFQVGLSSRRMPSMCLAPNGDVLLAAASKAGVNKLVRSKDKGRTWGPPETLPAKLGKVTDYGNTMFRTANGRLIVQLYRGRAETKKPLPEIAIAESTDNGLTWSDPAPAKVAEGWPEIPATLTPYGPLLETEDGTLLRFLLGSPKEPSKFTNVITWGSVHCKAYAIRSTDGGKSWSAPIELDRPGWVDTPRGKFPGSLDFTEPTGVAIGNKVSVLIRPIYSQTMWQCWSDDAGATWDSAARATFPGYAQSMLRMQSGVILAAHRYPHYSVHISRDNGLNWDEGTVIDYPIWAMGCMVEVEPDVILCAYMNGYPHLPLLAQLIRVTKTGIEPVANPF